MECHRLCLETFTYCLHQGGEHAEADHLLLLLDCSDICQASANFMLRRSERHTSICEACAEVCQQCYEECEQMSDDAQMRACAELCRRCAESCQQMAP